MCSLDAKTLPLVATMWSCGGSNPEHDTMIAEHKAQMTADSAKHAEMEQMKQTTQRFLDLWFSENTDGIEEIVAENFVSHIPMPGVISTGIQQLKDMIAISLGPSRTTRRRTCTSSRRAIVW